MTSQIDNEIMKDLVAQAVAYIIDTRVAMNRPPFLATMTNIKNVMTKGLDSALEALTKEGVLAERKTLNERAFEFNRKS